MTAVNLCFIDDSAYERDLFARVLAGRPGLEPVIAASFAEAQAALGPRVPLAFLLDLWGNDPARPAQARLMERPEIEPLAAAIKPLAQVWEGLAEFPGDRLNEFLKRLYTVLSGWQEVFLAAARAADQSRAYGLHNLAQVRKHYPGVAALGYTRKSQPADLVAFLAAGGDGALLKPHGPDEPAILAATQAQAGSILAQAGRVAARRTAEALLTWSVGRLGPEAGYLYSLAGAILGKTPLPRVPKVNLEPYLARYVEAVRDWLTLRAEGLHIWGDADEG